MALKFGGLQVPVLKFYAMGCLALMTVLAILEWRYMICYLEDDDGGIPHISLDVYSNYNAEIIARVFHDKSHRELTDQIRLDRRLGKRDEFYKQKDYLENKENKHFNDITFSNNLGGDSYQKDVYALALTVATQVDAKKVVDVGCGSGYKLVNMIASRGFQTTGFETEPAISYLRQTYPNLTWFESGSQEETMPELPPLEEVACDVGICADVIEHIRNPHVILDFLSSLKCSRYVISTPKPDALKRKNGPPTNPYHVREWTFHEFMAYLESRNFTILHSIDGIQHDTTQMHVVSL